VMGLGEHVVVQELPDGGVSGLGRVHRVRNGSRKLHDPRRVSERYDSRGRARARRRRGR
jgi:hypothetical protein